jgi:hypothetical protein
MYVEAFEVETKHMQLFRAFVLVNNPHFLTQGGRDLLTSLPGVRVMAKATRSEQLGSLARLLAETACTDELEFLEPLPR